MGISYRVTVHDVGKTKSKIQETNGLLLAQKLSVTLPLGKFADHPGRAVHASNSRTLGTCTAVVSEGGVI